MRTVKRIHNIFGAMARSAGLVLVEHLKQPTEIAFLLLQASSPPYHWSPPKGHVDHGETDLDAAIRETEEETGYGRNAFNIVENSRHEISYKITESVAHPEDVGKLKTVVYWLATIRSDDDVQVSSEHSKQRWVPLKEAKEMLTLPGMPEMLDKYAQMLQ